MKLHPKVWLPVAVIAVLAWANGTLPKDHVPTDVIIHGPDCATIPSDGPQFDCWLRSQG